MENNGENKKKLFAKKAKENETQEKKSLKRVR